MGQPDPGGSAVAPEPPLPAPAPSPQRLYLHIGLPKSGSTYLQSLLAANRDTLREHGFVYPFVGEEGMFHAALEVAGHPHRWGFEDADVAGTFDRLLAKGGRLGGTTILSHEIFSAANAKQVRAIGERLGGFEVHVVITIRDAARTITAQWQERVKNGFPVSFADFAAGLLSHLPEQLDETMKGFWKSQNLGWVLHKWGQVVPPERIHVVVTPAPGAPSDLLWRRFCSALDIPVDAIDLSDEAPRNESLGVAQLAFLRQVVRALDRRLEQPWFSVVAKRWFAQSVLSEQRSAKPVAPVEVTDRLAQVARVWIGLLESAGYRIYGDLEELVPVAVPGADAPDDVALVDVYSAVPAVVARMLLHERDQRLTIQALEARAAALTLERDRLAAELAEHQEAASRRRRWAPPQLGIPGRSGT